MKKIELILEAYPEEHFSRAAGFDDAIIGVDEDGMRLIYSVRKCLDILQLDMNLDDAWDYFTYNVSGTHVGEKTPVWCMDVALAGLEE